MKKKKFSLLTCLQMSNLKLNILDEKKCSLLTCLQMSNLKLNILDKKVFTANLPSNAKLEIKYIG